MSQCHVLLTIYEQKETTTVELSKELAIDKSNLSRLIDFLVKQRYVERVASKKDRRYSKIKITAKGKSKAVQINKSANDHYTKVFENIPEWKHKEIVENLTLLTLAFNAEENTLLNIEEEESYHISNNDLGKSKRAEWAAVDRAVRRMIRRVMDESLYWILRDDHRER